MAFEWATFDVDYAVQKNELEREEIFIEIPQEIKIQKPKPKPMVKQKAFNPKQDNSFTLIDNKDSIVDKVVEKPLFDTSLFSQPIIHHKGADEKPLDIDTIHQFVDKQPEFPGGEKALYLYLGENIHYPRMAVEGNVQGKVFVQFIVEKDGNISQAKVVKGIGNGCDKEAIRVIKNMPTWKPGWKDGLPVRTRFSLPVYYKLK